MPSPSAILTYRDYAGLPPDGRRYEVHDGELSVAPAPSPRHQRVVRALFEALHHHVQRHRLGEVLFAPLDVILSATTVVQPDLVYLDGGRRGALSDRGVEGPPTLVVEVLSPSSAAIDRGVKQELYARHRVPFFWRVDPEAEVVEVFVLGPGGYSLELRAGGSEPLSPPPFSGLALVPATLWPSGGGLPTTENQ